jgi:rod shape-determining protein MreC
MLWDILWRNKNTFSLTFCLAFSLGSIVWKSGANPLAVGAGAVGSATDRIRGVLNSGFQLPGVLFVEIAKYRELEKRYEQALKTIEESRLEKDKFDFLKKENERLRNVLGFSLSPESPEIKAEVLGTRLNSISPRIVIGKGREDGVLPFMPVLAHSLDRNNHLIRAVVGIVAFASESVSVVQPISHPEFRIGVRLPDGNMWAILSGNSSVMGKLDVTNLSTRTSLHDSGKGENSKGGTGGEEIVVSSGEGGIFPRGIPVGYLNKQGDGFSYVEPIVDIGSLDYVIVVQKRPEKWTENWERNINWEEHLMTEFGPAVYSDRSPSVKKGRKSADDRKPSDQAVKAVENPEKKPKPSGDSMRRIQNTNPLIQ